MPHFRALFIIFLSLLFAPTVYSTPQECPKKPDTAKKPSVKEFKVDLICRCDDENTDGLCTLSKAQAEKYRILLSTPLLEKYDRNCNLILDPDELDCSLIAMREKIRKDFDEQLSKTKNRIKGQKIPLLEPNTDYYEKTDALKIVRVPEPEKSEIKVGYANASSNAKDSDKFSISYEYADKPWVALTTNTEINLVFAIGFSHDRVKTSSTEVTTRSVDFLPVQFKWKIAEDFSASLKLGYSRAKEKSKDLNANVREQNTAGLFAQEYSLTWQSPISVIALGVSYKRKTEQFFDKRFSEEWLPTITFNLLKL